MESALLFSWRPAWLNFRALLVGGFAGSISGCVPVPQQAGAVGGGWRRFLRLWLVAVACLVDRGWADRGLPANVRFEIFGGGLPTGRGRSAAGSISVRPEADASSFSLLQWIMSNKSPIDTIQLPQGGGAISGMGEKFSPDLFTGTGNFSVPIAVPPGRNGMQPSLSLGYSTGSGNSPFGLGWGLSVPGVMRSTSKGLPRYVESSEFRDQSSELRGGSLADTFVLSGAEDLVPVPGGSALAFGELGFVQWYRPRTEGLFARIERHLDAANDFWKVWTKEGLVSYYGTENAAGNDPCTVHDPADPSKVFGWKLSRTEDVFRNRIVYVYERDLVNVDGAHFWEQSYLKSVMWNDFKDGLDERYLTTVEFVYGKRPDPFSEYHAGFEVRTVRRCEEIQILHHPTLTGGSVDTLVKSYKLTYLDERVAVGDLPAELLPLNGVSLLARVQVFGHDGSAVEALPPLDFGYSTFE